MHLPSLLLLWPLALLCLSGVLANQDSSKYELILYWRLRQFMINSVGVKGNTVAPDCPSPCDFKAFMQTLTVKRKGPTLKNPDGVTNQKDAKGRALHQYYPDYDKDFTVFTDKLFSDPEAAVKALDNVQFTGQFKKESQFKGAKTFGDIILSVSDAIKKSQAALVAAGRDPNGGWLKEIRNLVGIAANGRRYNRATAMTEEFEKWLKANGLEGLEVKKTDPIQRAPFVYQKIDLQATYDEGVRRGVKGIEDWEIKIKVWAVIRNAQGAALGHVRCIRGLDKIARILDAKCK
ncbi:uncharacterized protein TRIVIDRAFT_209337 [Trichoderma virens Gv29-8]|uniref:Uncharacterized protein n=1 Tax=Hypocrea virens (strain Gv29-8 / FGSC 10586) TaxID=413071 RepID=G9MU73_HYPVG|nr:uncharacterized protein TRIVIDRAFT_209337 [Trichoderma virens Gv29-8]EHK22012.1 hypothetical protein TRIVIDRAFT_209337 [Trichoderma virens Gv29-8]UKZ50511.1 hypothetical protein TrVGV298_004774 [Trichoderma virens]UKZ76855.1 hypothetical protein TrVFT333_004570 [Trichoderma virens FT-333]